MRHGGKTFYGQVCDEKVARIAAGIPEVRLIPNAVSGNAADQCHVRSFAVKDQSHRNQPAPLYIWFSRRRQATVRLVRPFTRSKIQDLLKVRE